MKVSINAGGREVTIETTNDVNLAPGALADEALRIWRGTEGAEKPGDGPAYGFQAERVRDRPVAGGRFGGIDPVQARGDDG